MKRTRTLMLDMDGTLLDLAFDMYVWTELMPKRFAAANDLAEDEARDILFAEFVAKHGQLDWYCLNHWADFLKVDVLQVHHDVSHRIGYLPGALEFLRHVHQQDVRVLLVTNAHPDLLEIKDAKTGLTDFFDGVHSSHDYGHAKESQEFWSALQDDAGFDPATTMFVDDSTAVLASAQKYGVETLFRVTRPNTTAPAIRDSAFRGIEKVADLLSEHL